MVGDGLAQIPGTEFLDAPQAAPLQDGAKVRRSADPPRRLPDPVRQLDHKSIVSSNLFPASGPYPGSLPEPWNPARGIGGTG